MHDLVIRGGTIIDGNGGEPFAGDIAVDGGRIAQAGGKAGPGRRELDAAGALVAPGFVDVHTHYDGQATWDSELAPSSWHGVTTVVMGNCGVGFAPARPDAHHSLIRMMEGVEDIPGAALAEGLTWDWETFPEYLDALEVRPRAIDIAAQVPHCAVRAYAMGERGIANEPADEDDVRLMADVVREALRAGARGFTTTRTIAHLTADGDRVPGAFAEERELLGLADAVGAVGGRTIGWISDLDEEAYELGLLRRMAERAGGRTWLTVVQRDERPDQWASVLGYLEEAAADGVALHAQVAARPVGLMLGLSASLHPFSTMPAYREIAHLPLAERVAILHRPDFRARLLGQRRDHRSRLMQDVTGGFHKMFTLGDPPDYEPAPESSVLAEAERRGMDSRELVLDRMLEREGRELIFFPFVNYSRLDHGDIRRMMDHPRTVLGLGDGGAHCGLISDASIPTYVLTHWGRDRRRGPGFPLPRLVKALTADTAALYGFSDRGRLEAGLRADINVIDFDRLRLHPPVMVHDLPAGGRRLVQRAEGYRATVCAGEVTFEEGEATGALPGRLARAA